MRSLLNEIHSYCERTGTPVSLFGRRALGDSSVMIDIRKGRVLGERNIARVRAFIAANPEGVRATRFVPPPKECIASEMKSPWEARIESRLASDRLREATILLRPESAVPTRKLTFEERLALVEAGKAKLVSAVLPTRAYDYTLAGVSW